MDWGLLVHGSRPMPVLIKTLAKQKSSFSGFSWATLGTCKYMEELELIQYIDTQAKSCLTPSLSNTSL